MFAVGCPRKVTSFPREHAEAMVKKRRAPVVSLMARMLSSNYCRVLRGGQGFAHPPQAATLGWPGVPWLGIQPKTMYSMCALKPAKRPPTAWLAMATLVKLRSPMPSIMPTWVLRKPALQIPMAV